jgi:Tat protein secretion system quality control protein TatD with DNase activity
MYLIDSHAHIYLPEFDDNRESFINQASVAGVQKIFMPAIDSSTHEKMLEVERSFPSCLSMMGLHPCSVKENCSRAVLKEKKIHCYRRDRVGFLLGCFLQRPAIPGFSPANSMGFRV